MIRTGIVRSSIGNSPEILRFLWGRYAVERGADATFLEPTEERLAMERRIDRYGVNLQVWVYYHILADRELSLSAWGANDPRVPAWQRALLPLIFPLGRAFLNKAFRLSEEHYRSACGHIEKLLGDVESLLDDGRRSILGGEETDFVDITFAALSTIWVRPENFARGEADRLLPGDTNFPMQMAVDIERWSDQFPLAKAFVERLYREERDSG
jgi:glutathione S-transferase